MTFIERPLGGRILAAVCNDGVPHVFLEHPPKSQRVGPVTACGQLRRAERAPRDEEEMCPSCAIRSEAWASGGPLHGGDA